MAETLSPSTRRAHPHLEAYREEIERCYRCGLCRSVCPSFAASGAEYASPRGRVQFARAVLEGNARLDRTVREHIFDCLNCMKCVEICPASVRTDRIVVAARAEFARRGKIGLIKKFMFTAIIRSARMLRLSAFAGRLARRWFMEPGGALDTLGPRLMGLGDKTLPDLTGRTAMNRLPEVNPALYGEPNMRVAYFVGCATNYISPHIAEAAVSVLTRNNIEVIIPRGQVCCGIPVYSSGDLGHARDLAAKNRAVFDGLGADCIVTDCASCSAALKHEVTDLTGAKLFDVPVYDLTEFLASVIDIDRDFGPLPGTVTWHDPCHLVRGQGIAREPRELLGMIPELELREMTGAGDCCGGAGAFAYTHHDLSRAVGASKALHIRETGADMVATSCPACVMQITDLLTHEGIDTPIVHPVELLDRAYRQNDVADDQFIFVEPENPERKVPE